LLVDVLITPFICRPDFRLSTILTELYKLPQTCELANKYACSTGGVTVKCYTSVVQDNSTILYNILLSLNYSLSIVEELNVDGNFLLFQINALDNSVLSTVSIVCPQAQYT
jgi:hypothetical protein